MSRWRWHPEVREALAARAPVVALETAVLTTGLPRASAELTLPIDAPGWNTAGPTNLEAMRLMMRLIRAAGAVPAPIAVLDGEVRAGLDDDELERLALDELAGKVGVHSIAHAVVNRISAGTTVSATLHACATPREHPDGPSIDVFATGGVGGVHRGWTDRPDVSADLMQIARSPVCIVCSGAKSILDLPATLELLESAGVPVVGYRTDRLPRFHATGSPDLPVPMRVDSPAAAAFVCRTHWRELNLRSGVVLANPVPEPAALDPGELDAIIASAEQEADEQNIRGGQLTPFLLEAIARETAGRSLIANIALLASNAALAAEVAVQLRKEMDD